MKNGRTSGVPIFEANRENAVKREAADESENLTL
jgi:hypothetical protein